MSRPPKKARVASLHDEAYQEFVELLVVRRKAAELSQQELADLLGWNQSIVAKIETAQRRIDIIELIRLADAAGFDVTRLVNEAKKILVRRGQLKA